MAAEDILKSLQEFDVNDLDVENIGSWPLAIKVVVWTVAFVAVLVLGYLYHVQNLQTSLQQAAAKEEDLRAEFETPHGVRVLE